jgi:hypothetical protein
MLKMVVFPLPLGPMIENILFFSTSKLILSTALMPPKEMLRFSTLKCAISFNLEATVCYSRMMNITV